MFSVTETPKHGKTHTIFFTKHTCTIQYSYDFIYTYSILVSPIPKHELFFLFISLHILGIYVCAKCDHPLFSSVSKYEHQTPWPAFTNPLRNDSLSKKPETDPQDSSECYALKVFDFLKHIWNNTIHSDGFWYLKMIISLFINSFLEMVLDGPKFSFWFTRICH